MKSYRLMINHVNDLAIIFSNYINFNAHINLCQGQDIGEKFYFVYSYLFFVHNEVDGLKISDLVG